MRAALLALLVSVAAHAEPPAIRLFVAIASNIGDPEDPPLHFADADARRALTLFVDIGKVAPERAYLVVGQPANVVREKLAEVAGRIAELRAAGSDVVLLLYVSGHAKAGVLHLSGTHLPLAELRDFAEKTGARLRVLVIDACDSGAILRQKGGAPGPEYDVSLEQLPLSGQVVISSSGPAEPSQEWDALGGSLFTHHLLTGLRGDADTENIGRVTLSEAYAYAYRRTVVEAAKGTQHPAFDFDLRGAGDLVLSEPGAAHAALIFPAALDGRYVVASQPRPDVVAEIEKHAGRALRLAVPPGRYLIRKWMGASVGLLSMELPYGGEATVRESDMVRRHFADVVAKGGTIELTPSAVFLSATLATSPLTGTGPRWNVGVGLRQTWGEYWATATASYGHTHFRGESIFVNENAAAFSLAGGMRFFWSAFIPYLGIAVDITGIRQNFVRDNEATIERVFGGGPLPIRAGVGVALAPVLGLEIPLPLRAFVDVEAKPAVRYLHAEGQSDFSLGISGQLALGFRY